jgi:hypothetical protein
MVEELIGTTMGIPAPSIGMPILRNLAHAGSIFVQRVGS